MKKDFSDVLGSLTSIKPHLVQVAAYTSSGPRCVIILDREPPHLLDGLSPLRDYCNKRNLLFPLVITTTFVEKSLDSFPLEFLDIITGNYQNLYSTEDLLEKLQFERSDVLLQIERELKSKWLLTRLSVLEGSSKPKAIAEVMHLSIRSILPALKGFCYVHDRPVPQSLPELLAQTTAITGVELKFLGQWLQQDKADTFTIKSYVEILQSLITFLEKSE